jgi:ElaB/YqjD/DUF883 family membrane-anchored ribosome-binding protein
MPDGRSEKSAEDTDDLDIGTSLSNLKDDISRLRTDLLTLSKHVTNRGKGYARDTTEKIIESLGSELDKLGEDKDKVIEKLREELGIVQQVGREKIETFEEKIQENPLTSLLIAFLAGLFFGKMFDRK